MSRGQARAFVLAVVVGLAALAYGPRGGVDGVTVTKATVVVLGALVVLGVALAGAVRAGRLAFPLHASTAVLATLIGLMGVSAVANGDAVRGVLGAFGRWNGLGLYLACAVLFLAALVVRGRAALQHFLRGMVVSGLAGALFAVDEAFLRIGPDWAQRPGVAGTLGNANFLAAWAGVVLAAVVGVAAARDEVRGWRLTAAGALPLLVAALALSASIQAGYVAMAVLAVLGLVVAHERLPRGAFAGVAGAAGLAGAVAAVLTVAGALGRGPAAVLGEQIGVRLRVEYWSAAGRMVADHPLLGVGPGTFGDHYRAYRSPQAAAMVSAESTADAAHNVPLGLAAEWGLLVAVAYFAFVVLVTVTFLREVGRRSGADRLRYGAVGAAWCGYVLQSWISIDTPALAVLGWVLAGLIVAPQVERWWTWELPWAPTTRKRGLPIAAKVATGATALVLLVGAWAASLPWRADAASADPVARVAPDADQTPRATTAATRLAPWEERYWLHLVRGLIGEGQHEYLWETMEQALDVGGGRLDVQVTAARIALELGEPEQARDHYEQVLHLDPYHPDILTEVAAFARDHGDNGWADELVERALEVDPDHEGARELAET